MTFFPSPSAVIISFYSFLLPPSLLNSPLLPLLLPPLLLFLFLFFSLSSSPFSFLFIPPSSPLPLPPSHVAPLFFLIFFLVLSLCLVLFFVSSSSQNQFCHLAPCLKIVRNKSQASLPSRDLIVIFGRLFAFGKLMIFF